MKFELVLPCYNEEKSLRYLIERVKHAAETHQMTELDFQLIIVDNGSRDGSAKLLGELSGTELKKWFRVVNVMPNKGYGHGIWQGLQTVTAEYGGWSHADEQCDPMDAFKALRIAELNKQEKLLVKGVRFGRSFKEILVSRGFDLCAWILLGFRVFEINAQPKVFRRELLEELVNPPLNFSFDLYVLYRAAKSGYLFITFPVAFPARVHGLSNWAFSLKSRYQTILGMITYMKELSRTEGRL